ncbi:MAG TPA: ABC transporter ATP-binding protein [Candidatus Microbacterium stercoravium]|uniref:ABC transporter ATP-binding protein n=1 Tax=Candidatus Microbacterium stercoravium TaxID=2838697 RepID=A0A9D2H8A2_9MICO|nr:ABC transporter ATP-binding protein [Candidatus Microbacterium stercoravium]
MVIDVQGLTMRYGDHVVLDDVSFDVGRGEVVALLGPNGAGKSTTIETLEGLRRPSAGTVRVLGRDPQNADDAWRSRLGVVLQTWNDHGKWTVRSLLDHFSRLYSAIGPARDVDELLEEVGLSSLASQKLSVLSGGQRRRLDIALAVLGQPELVLMDEPTAGFDPESRRSFQHLIAALTQREMSCLITTHDLDEAERVADRIVILNRGTVVAAGTMDELAAQTGAGDEVTWESVSGEHRRLLSDSTAFVRELLNDSDAEVRNLRVKRRSLEEIYLAIVRGEETVDEREPATLSSDI